MPEINMSPASPVLKRSDTLTEPQWESLLSRINKQKCTPFLGPETCFDFSIPSASVIAEEWARKYDFPLEDRTVLPRVAQFVAYNVLESVEDVKIRLVNEFGSPTPPDFSNPNEPYRILSSIPLKVYINTHYYAFMSYALISQRREPRRTICRWYENQPTGDEEDIPPAYDPSVACPLVFHMFGHISEERSLVLLEDDYLEFLVRTSVHPDLIPRPVQNAMRNNSLLFFGYQATDLDFRVILRTLNRIWEGVPSNKSTNYTIQMIHVGEKAMTSSQVELIRQYFNNYCSKCAQLEIKVHWGSTNDFMTELRQRWEEYHANHPTG